jgi:hypothetical protein
MCNREHYNAVRLWTVNKGKREVLHNDAANVGF